MTQIVENCPRCGAQKTTFDVLGSNPIGYGRNDWQLRYEAFAVCRHCDKSTVFVLELYEYDAFRIFANQGLNGLLIHKGSLMGQFKCLGFISLKNQSSVAAPEHLPAHIEFAFQEGATCLQVECFNAAGTMFRLCVDYATQELLPPETAEDSPKGRQRRDLGLRMQWLFDHKYLPEDLHELALCIKEDGNDGAHRGTLSKADAEDLLDFTSHLLDRRYSVPERLAAAAIRRANRPR